MGNRQLEGSWQDAPVTLDSLIASWPHWAPNWDRRLTVPKNVYIARTKDLSPSPDHRYLRVIADLSRELQLTQIGDIAAILERIDLEKLLEKFIGRRIPRKKEIYKFSDDYLSMICIYMMAKRQLGRIPKELAKFAPRDL